MVQDISDLPEELRIQTAAWVEDGSLPALRLVSCGWNEAANRAVRQLKCDYSLQPEQMILIGQRWPNLERLILNCHRQPDRYCRYLMSSLMALNRIQHLSLDICAALLPEGQEFILRQTRLLSLYTIGDFALPLGASDGLLQVISRLSHLTRLECGLQPDCCNFDMRLPIEPATDRGVQCLSSLQTLQDLTLTFSRFPASQHAVTGQALSSIGSLHQLTHLSLGGWPMVDADLDHLKDLQLHSLELRNCQSLTSGCLMHVRLLTSLHSLNMGVPWDIVWGTEEERDAYKELAIQVLPFLTVEHFN